MNIKPNSKATAKHLITSDKNQEKDWWDKIREKEKSEIKEGLAQADRGEVVSYREVMEKYKKWR